MPYTLGGIPRREPPSCEAPWQRTMYALWHWKNKFLIPPSKLLYYFFSKSCCVLFTDWYCWIYLITFTIFCAMCQELSVSTSFILWLLKKLMDIQGLVKHLGCFIQINLFHLFYELQSCKLIVLGNDIKRNFATCLGRPWVLGLHERELNQLNANLLLYHFFHVCIFLATVHSTENKLVHLPTQPKNIK